MRRSLQFKVKMSRSAERRAGQVLALCCELYNAALEERIGAWKRQRVSVSFYDQVLQMPDVRRDRPDVAALDAQVLRDPLRRVALAFDGFFRRVKAGQKPGHPRFKSRSRYDSATFQQTGWKLNGRKLTLRGIGTLRLFLSRPIEGDVKTVTLRRDRCGDWFVTFSCDNVPAKPLAATGRSVGVDLGLTSFAATSDGETVDNPRHLKRHTARLRQAQRRLCKAKRGGNRRKARVCAVAKVHRKVQRTRRDFHFKTALDLVRRYDTIAVEDLNVRGLARGMLAKAVNDAAWADFIAILRTKAEEAGRTVMAVNPAGTSQACSGCGCVPERRKTLADRVHDCLDCGLVMDRDVNAARNILTLAGAPPAASGRRSKVAA